MEDLLIELLTLCFHYPVRRQGSILEDEPYPDNFFTFWNNASDGYGFYDNDETQIIYNYDVNFYSVDPERVYSVLRQAKKILKENGFECWGDAHDVLSDEPTHSGRGITVEYLKNLQEE